MFPFPFFSLHLHQVAASTGHMGCPALCCALFALSTAYMAVTWEKDLNSPRFMLSGFLANLNNTANTLRANRQMLVFVCISALCESSIMIFTFYWAPWMALIAQETDQHLPFEIVFATLMLSSLLGEYYLWCVSVGHVIYCTPFSSVSEVDFFADLGFCDLFSIGNYLFQLYCKGSGAILGSIENTFQVLLCILSIFPARRCISGT